MLGRSEHHSSGGTRRSANLDLQTRAVRRALGELPEPERDALTLRYGFDDDEPKTLAETDRRLGITPERARKLETDALDRLAV